MQEWGRCCKMLVNILDFADLVFGQSNLPNAAASLSDDIFVQFFYHRTQFKPFFDGQFNIHFTQRLL